MGRGNKRQGSSRSKSRRTQNAFPGRALFVVGGALSEWQATDSTPRGKNLRGGHGRGGSNIRSGDRSVIKLKNNSGSDSKSRNESMKSRGSAIAYAYPSDDGQEGLAGESSGEVKGTKLEKMHPLVLVDSQESKIVAFVDEGQSKEPQNTKLLYEYGTSFTLGDGSDDEQQEMECVYECSTSFSVDESMHRGLGFFNKAEATSGVGSSSKPDEKDDFGYGSSCSEEDMDAEFSFLGDDGENSDGLPAKKSSRKKNEGFLTFGGLRLYTQDISEEEEDDDNDDDEEDEESSDSSENSSDSNDSLDSDSEIDDDVAADYLESTGGIAHSVNVDQLVGLIQEEDDKLDEALEKLGGIALQETSMKYGMKKQQPRRKSLGKLQFTPSRHALPSAFDDLMLVKDPRTASGRKKHAAKFPQSWPFESQKSKHSRRFPGEKKKHRKEMIAMKRRERMIRRGVDLQKINARLQQMVLDEADIMSFEPMHTKDCSQVCRVASVYHLWSSSQGSGKKRFVTVARTPHTCMPSPHGRARLEQLIGANEEDDDDFVVNDNLSHGKGPKAVNKSSRGQKCLYSTPRDSKFSQTRPLKDLSNSGGNKKDSSSRKKRDSKPSPSYSSQPVSFISSGIMGSETAEQKAADEPKESSVSCSVQNYGAFELHTTGFGSKMMVKMGFTGGGLGKDGQGIAEPIQVSQRPKTLGLGAPVAEPSTVQNVSNSKGTHTESLGRGEGLPRRSASSGKKGCSRIIHKPRDGSQGFATFENHTKGFGSKMMARMGFVEGMGLGKDSQGITTPIHAVRRPKSQGLGSKK
ncbi:unnamed protein product [Cuscuta campestris]|uniref:G-patch domain-containing protein n=1 Tax=Cuscuta campestris TaxID=132261 RepID=A0A484NNF4_9ASTE|nr:unnamed protein product [Cuscuta campestris]